uniref:Hist_deacetyl domain-containing protein n=1 Tax=Ascaris lumbricoides TaxID=6252 RepID=A0A0M3IET7_ASCLU
MEEYCRGHELLWLCPDSVNIARLVVGGVIDLVKENIEERFGNGFAIVRPPGHHSYGKLPQGFCIFNNVSIAAKFAVERLNVRKVKIVEII